MKTLYIECNMGAAGDMLMGALLELHPDADGFIDRMNNICIPHVEICREKSVKCGITGTHIVVTVNGHHEGNHMHEHGEHHHHSGMHDIEHIVAHINVPDRVKKNILSVYKIIAEAESEAHGVEMEHIHFHEVGTLDAVADITGVCLLMDELGADRVVVSPVHTGSGSVKCAHGILPVPAPATALILRGVPIYGGSVSGELCTPTGAALLKYFADEFGDMPVMSVDKIGIGMGSKDFETANCVRVFLGEAEEKRNKITELCCNVDDMTGEEIGFAMDMLLEGGAREVFTTPVGMKKSRPGIMLTCICDEEQKKELLRLIFKHTTTIGVREKSSGRYVLSREIMEMDTKYGKVRAKKSEGYGVSRIKVEYEDAARIAHENKMSISQVREEINVQNN